MNQLIPQTKHTHRLYVGVIQAIFISLHISLPISNYTVQTV
jgi:hypothetical protein